MKKQCAPLPEAPAERKTKKHEFQVKGDPSDVFIVFEGMEDEPFRRCEKDGIRFVDTGLTFRSALFVAEQPNSSLEHTISETTIDEYDEYFSEAHNHHHTPIR